VRIPIYDVRMKWSQVIDTHAQAIASFAETAQRIPQDRWLQPRAEGKWSPGEILEHLNLTYESVQGNLEGGPGMRILTKWWMRIPLRMFVVPRILRGGWFPAGARAPREIRPAQAAPDRDAAIATLRERAKRLEDKAISVQAAGGTKLAHAYFGHAALPQSLLLVARHVEHHQRQLAEMLSEQR
jgi:hypothetical protein